MMKVLSQSKCISFASIMLWPNNDYLNACDLVFSFAAEFPFCLDLFPCHSLWQTVLNFVCQLMIFYFVMTYVCEILFPQLLIVMLIIDYELL